jgi:uncharacterized protein (TIGR03086 family)
MDSIAMCQRTLDAAGKMIGSVKQDDMARPTPCSEWNVRALINHMIGVNHAFARALAGEKIERGGQMPDLVGDDPAASYTAAATAALEAWRAPGALERTLALPPGDVPGSVGINIHMTDQSVHTWDLAKALDREHAIDPKLAEVSLAPRAAHLVRKSLARTTLPSRTACSPLAAAAHRTAVGGKARTRPS